MSRLGADQVRRARVARQGLAGPAGSVVDAVRRVVGVQAQDLRASRLAVRARTSGLTAADVDAACRDRTMVRTWAMRGTLHLLAAGDFWWVNGLLGPYFADRGAGRRRQLGLDDPLLERAAEGLEAHLREPLTRREVVERLDLPIDADGQAPAHLLAWAANVGLVCRGPETGRDEPTYVLVREWLGPRPDIDDPVTTLARRYLAGYGPATADDLAAWSGLPLTRVRKGLAAADAQPVDLDGATAYTLAEEGDHDNGSHRDREADQRGGDRHGDGGGNREAGQRGRGREAEQRDGDGERGGPVADRRVRLLGHFDAYLLGYRGRDLAVPAGLRSRVQTGGGLVMPTVLVDGRVVGTWRPVTTREGLVVEVRGETPDGIGNEVADIGRFLGVRTELTTTTG